MQINYMKKLDIRCSFNFYYRSLISRYLVFHDMIFTLLISTVLLGNIATTNYLKNPIISALFLKQSSDIPIFSVNSLSLRAFKYPAYHRGTWYAGAPRDAASGGHIRRIKKDSCEV